MTDSVVARRYANALFTLGKKAGAKELEQYGSSLTHMQNLLADSPELDKVFKSPVVTVREKRKVLEKILAQIAADKTMSNFCMLLADKGRLPFLREIATYYGTLLDTEKGVIRGHILTAVALDAKKQGQIKTLLEKKAGKSLELAFDVDKSILGGVVLKVGDRVLDASLRAQLAILRDTIKRGE